MFGEKRSRSFDLAVIVSTVIHIGLLFVFSRARSPDYRMPDGTEVGFMDITYRPEVAQVATPEQPSGPGREVEAPYATPSGMEPLPEIDLASMDRDRSQARVDLERFEPAPVEQILDVIRLGGEGTGKTTEEILVEPPVALSRGLDRDGTGTAGLRGYPGVRPPEAQLQIEHRPLAEAPARLPTTEPKPSAVVAPRPSGGTGVSVAGPISGRRRIREPRPQYPKWALDRRISGTVMVRVWVAPNGTVKGTPEVRSSSGYPDLDQAVVRALRGWEFEPLGAGVQQEDQYGDITFHFRLS